MAFGPENSRRFFVSGSLVQGICMGLLKSVTLFAEIEAQGDLAVAV